MSLLLIAACDGGGTGEPGASPAAVPAPAPEAAAAPAAAGDDVLSRLAAADAADGTVDHVIRKCVTCSLHMDGDPAHKATAHGYEVHLCSENCLYRFERDPDGAVMAMKPAQ